METVSALAIVVPCYNEEAVLPEVVGRLSEKIAALIELQQIADGSCILFVDDGSTDETWSLIEQYASQHDCVKGLKLSRNQGHQMALLAGLLNAPGDAIVSIDADLQDDIDAIDQMVDEYRKGNEVVYGVRSRRNSDTSFKRISAESYYRLLQKMGVNLIFNHADYRLLSRRAIESLREFKEVNLFLRGVVPMMGYKASEVYYERSERFAGESKYPLKKMVAFAIEGITSFSNIPLRLITALGFIVSLFAFGMVFWVLMVKSITGDAVPGWASTIIPMLFLGGVQLLSLGVVGEYVAKIHIETKHRPPYFIEKSI